MKIYKEKHFICFELNKHNISFDLKNKKCYDNGVETSIFETELNNLYLKDIESYFEDKNYFELLKAIDKISQKNSYIKKELSIAEILNNLSKKHFQKYEQIYAAGLKVILYGDSLYSTNNEFPYTIKDIPKGLQKICKEYNYYLDNKFVKSYLKQTDNFNIVYNQKEKYKKLTKTDLKTIVTYKITNMQYILKYLQEKYNYDIKSFLLYLDYLKSEEHITNVKNLLSDYKDYIKLYEEINEHDFEKYPKNFKKTHDDLVIHVDNILDARERERNALAVQKFESLRKPEYEIEYKDYKFIYPKAISDIRKEGDTMHNCVATLYIHKVLSGYCHILFLRKKNALDESLVTIEVRKDKIVQARRKYNKPITSEDEEAVNYFNSYFIKNKN